MRALVTGAAGFVGQWTVRAMLARGWSVAGLSNTSLAGDALLGEEERAAVRWHEGDVRDRETLARIVDDERPEAIVHLAGIAFVPSASADPGVTVEVNVAATARLLGEVRLRRRAGTLDPVVLVIGSGEQYGRHEASEMPLREDAEQRPLTVYAATKAAQEVVALEAARSEGVRVVATRSFNHSGPGQAEHFLLPALVRRALRLRAEGGATMPIGNTTPVRDILHVRDVVEAYLRLLDRGAPGEAYNVASGRGWSVGDLAARVLERVGTRAALVPDPALVRAADVPILVGDAGKLRLATGWTPSLSCDDVIDDLIHAATH
jgi:GDP-4-dehydro-6-deoxy-D-mannose reductase